MSEVRKIQIQDGKGNIYHPQTVSEQVLDLDKRLEGLAKETYVDEKIAAIPEVDLSDIENNILTLEENKADKTDVDKKADKTDVDSKLSLKADKTYVDDKISQIPEVDLTPINNDILRLEENKADMDEVETRLSLKANQSELEALQDKSLTFDIFDKGVIKSYQGRFSIQGKGVIFLANKVEKETIYDLEIDDKSVGKILQDSSQELTLYNVPIFLPFYRSVKGYAYEGIKVLLV